MKKIIKYLPVMFIFISCNKNECYKCEMQGRDSFEVCEDEFEDYNQFRYTVSQARSVGWECEKLK